MVEKFKKESKPKTQLEADTAHWKFGLNLYILQDYKQWKAVSKSGEHQAATLMGAIDSFCNVHIMVNRIKGNIVKCNTNESDADTQQK